MREPVLQGSASLELIAHGCRCCASPFWQQVRPSFQGGRGKRSAGFQHLWDPASNILPDTEPSNVQAATAAGVVCAPGHCFAAMWRRFQKL